MITPQYVRLMAAYTQWQNISLYSAAETLTEEARQKDRGAFFGSIHATLNHVLWGDQFWMHRLAGTKKPTAPNIESSATQFDSWDGLRAARAATDKAIVTWASTAESETLSGEWRWFSAAKQTEISRPRWALVVHLFNHGTHHRGQVHAMLTAAGAKPDDTDLPFTPGEYYAWM